MTDIREADIDTVINIVASSGGDLSLSAERFDRKHGNKIGYTKEYDLEERLSLLDMQTADTLSAKFRTLLTVRLYNLIVLVTNQLQFSLEDLKPAELARTHTSLVNSFATLTAPATKITFDFEKEIQELVREFPDLTTEDIREELKSMDVKKLRAVK